MRIRRFRLERPPAEDFRWLAERMDRECARLGTRAEATPEGRLERWS